MTYVHQCSNADFPFVSLCFQKNLLFAPNLNHLPGRNRFELLPFLVHCCLFASRIFIAWGIGINLCTKLLCVIELIPLPTMWSSWLFGRDGFHSAPITFQLLGLSVPFFARQRSVHKHFQLFLILLMMFLYSPSSGSMKQMPLNLRALSSFRFSIAQGHTFSGLLVAWIFVHLRPDHKNPFGGFSFSYVNFVNPVQECDKLPSAFTCLKSSFSIFLQHVQISVSGLCYIKVFQWNRECFFFRHVELNSRFIVMTIGNVTLNRPILSGLQRRLSTLSVETFRFAFKFSTGIFAPHKSFLPQSGFSEFITIRYWEYEFIIFFCLINTSFALTLGGWISDASNFSISS